MPIGERIYLWDHQSILCRDQLASTVEVRPKRHYQKVRQDLCIAYTGITKVIPASGVAFPLCSAGIANSTTDRRIIGFSRNMAMQTASVSQRCVKKSRAVVPNGKWACRRPQVCLPSHLGKISRFCVTPAVKSELLLESVLYRRCIAIRESSVYFSNSTL